MRFKQYYYSTKNNRDLIFEDVFESYYKKGYFGKISKKVIREQQESWFRKFEMILEERNFDKILTALSNRENCTREWFSRIYKVDVVEKSRDDIAKVIVNIFKDGKK